MRKEIEDGKNGKLRVRVKPTWEIDAKALPIANDAVLKLLARAEEMYGKEK